MDEESFNKSCMKVRLNGIVEEDETCTDKENAQNWCRRFKQTFGKIKRNLLRLVRRTKSRKVNFNKSVRINEAPYYDRDISNERWTQRSEMEIQEIVNTFLNVNLEDYKRVRFEDEVTIFEVPYDDRKAEDICVSIDFLIERSRYYEKKIRDGKPYWRRLMIMSQELCEENLWIGRELTYEIQKEVVEKYRKMERENELR